MASQVTTLCKADEAELLRLWHTARIAGAVSRYDRLQYASREFNKDNPGVSKMAAYLYLDGVTRGY